MKSFTAIIFAVVVVCVSAAPATPWMVTDSSNNTCILATMDAEIYVSYTKTDQTSEMVSRTLPENSVVDATNSSCGSASDPAVLVLSFDEQSYVKQVFTLDANNTYSLTEFAIGLLHDETHFPNSTEAGNLVVYTGTPTDVFVAKNATSYRCNSVQVVSLQDGGNTTFTNVKVQPFGISGGAFSDESVCAADDVTTEAPTTSMNMTTAEPMTTFKPTPKPEIPAGNWTVNTTDGTCMNMTFKASFDIVYWTTDNTSMTLSVDLPDNATASASTCNDTNANFLLTFFDSWVMGMYFSRNGANDKTNGSFNLDSFNLTYKYDSHFTKPAKKDMMESVSNAKTNIETDVGKYYKCNSNSKIVAGNCTTILSEMQLQPFAQFTNGTKGENYTECVADNEISNIVPIAVGCALAGLVIIVLIAYLIGRSRSSRQGYQSV